MNLLARLPYDKALHVIAGVLLSLVGYAVAYAAQATHPEAFGVVLAVLVGVWKELRDADNPAHTASAMDAAATIAGGVLAMLPSLTRYLA